MLRNLTKESNAVRDETKALPSFAMMYVLSVSGHSWHFHSLYRQHNLTLQSWCIEHLQAGGCTLVLKALRVRKYSRNNSVRYVTKQKRLLFLSNPLRLSYFRVLLGVITHSPSTLSPFWLPIFAPSAFQRNRDGEIAQIYCSAYLLQKHSLRIFHGVHL